MRCGSHVQHRNQRGHREPEHQHVEDEHPVELLVPRTLTDANAHRAQHQHDQSPSRGDTYPAREEVSQDARHRRRAQDLQSADGVPLALGDIEPISFGNRRRKPFGNYTARVCGS